MTVWTGLKEHYSESSGSIKSVNSLKSSVVWDITPYSLLKVNQHFGENMLPALSGVKSKPNKKSQLKWYVLQNVT
jgi:hypothetical protein